MTVETGPGTTQSIQTLVEEARQLRRRQNVNIGIAAGGVVAVLAVNVLHNLFSIPRIEPSESVVQLGLALVAGTAGLRMVGCEFQGQYLDFRAITTIITESSKHPPTLS